MNNGSRCAIWRRRHSSFRSIGTLILLWRQKTIRKILDDVSVVHKGTLADLAKEFDMTDVVFTGFIDGINSSLSHEPYVLEELTPESEISLDIDLEKLFTIW